MVVVGTGIGKSAYRCVRLRDLRASACTCVHFCVHLRALASISACICVHLRAYSEIFSLPPHSRQRFSSLHFRSDLVLMSASSRTHPRAILCSTGTLLTSLICTWHQEDPFGDVCTYLKRTQIGLLEREHTARLKYEAMRER